MMCRMSCPQASTMASTAESSTRLPSPSMTCLMRRATAAFSGRLNLMSKQIDAKLRTCWSLRSLQMQMMGFFVDLIMLIRACMPPLSPPLMPSHSSMIITALSIALLAPAPRRRVWFPASEELMLSMMALPRASEALYSMSRYFGLQRATNVHVVVFPMPGGPLISAARALMFSGAGTNFVRGFSAGVGACFTFPRSTTSSQSRNHSASFRT
mmetsp:Transcript_54397/g.158011  ORF Transcript_54397/g.158011 Transcript_54397/m.158011 type:complete len:212 (-) Transcript_54397:176-811(-)